MWLLPRDASSQAGPVGFASTFLRAPRWQWGTPWTSVRPTPCLPSSLSKPPTRQASEQEGDRAVQSTPAAAGGAMPKKADPRIEQRIKEVCAGRMQQTRGDGVAGVEGQGSNPPCWPVLLCSAAAVGEGAPKQRRVRGKPKLLGPSNRPQHQQLQGADSAALGVDPCKGCRSTACMHAQATRLGMGRCFRCVHGILEHACVLGWAQHLHLACAIWCA